MAFAAAATIGAAAIGAGASIYSANKSAAALKSASKPVKVNLTGAQNLLSNYYKSAMPDYMSMEQQYRPQAIGQNLGDVAAFTGGYGGQPGLYDMMGGATDVARQQLGAARAGDLAQMTGQAGGVRNLLATMSPEQAAAVRRAQMEAERASASANMVTPQEQRMYQQTAREAAQASGRLGGNSAIAAEIMGRENVLAQKRGEASMANQNVYNLGSSFYGQPGMNMLQGVPTSYTTGAGLLNTGLGQIGSGTLKMFDIQAPVNYALAEAGRQTQSNQAMAQIAANQSAANMSALTSGLGSIASMYKDGAFGSGFNPSQYNTSASQYNAAAGAGTPLKAYVV